MKTKQGFTLIELLVVVAIVAVVGAGVAVTYRRLDERAKTAMETSDCTTLRRLIEQWSVKSDFKIPDSLDTLVDTSGDLYAKDATHACGLWGSSASTFVVGDPDPICVTNLAQMGVQLLYTHDASAAKANESTRTGGMVRTVAADAADAFMDALSDAQTHDYASGDFVAPDGTKYSSFSAYKAMYNYYDALDDAVDVTKLAFIYPGSTPAASEGGMNLTGRLIAEFGLSEDDVAAPNEGASDGKSCWLVVFGLGEHCDIYSKSEVFNRGVSLDAPAAGKNRYVPGGIAGTVYSRYLVVVRVPTSPYNARLGRGEAPRVVAVLSPQGLTPAMLQGAYQDEVAVEAN